MAGGNPIRNKLDSHAAIGYREIEAQVDDLNAVFAAARERIESRIFNYVRRNRSSFTGPRLVLLMEAIRDEYADFELKYTDKLKYALNYIVAGYYRDAMFALGLRGNRSIVASISKDRFELMSNDAFDHVAGATKNMADYAVAQLRTISARVMRESALTGESRAVVSRRLLLENNAAGMFGFIDRAGKRWNNQAYFDMLGRTLLHNNAREAYLQGCADQNCDIVTVSHSGNPCPGCAKFEGRLLSISGKTPGLTTLQQAMDDGLFHPNCTHRVMAVPESVAQENFTADGRPLSGVNSPGREENGTPATVQSELPLSGSGIKQNQPLTNAELTEVKEYTKSEGYAELNDYLRKGKSGAPDLDRKVEHLDQAIRKSTTEETLTLWRGVVDPVVMKIFESGNISTIDLKSFQSTSRSFDVACGFAGNDGRSAVVFKITVPKGKNALDVSSISHKPDEQEVLLPSTGKYRVDKVYYEKDDEGFIIRQIVEVTYE